MRLILFAVLVALSGCQHRAVEFEVTPEVVTPIDIGRVPAYALAECDTGPGGVPDPEAVDYWLLLLECRDKHARLAKAYRGVRDVWRGR